MTPSTPTLAAALLLAVGCSDASMSPGDAGSADGAARCATQAECDDQLACTRDTCVVGGVCQHEPDDTRCTAPQTCRVGVGCATPGAMTCRATSECDDHLACTADVCLVEGVCRHTPRPEMCPTGQSCDLTAGCTAMSMSTTCATDASCDDRLECTVDRCDSEHHCANVPQNARCGTGQRCVAGMGCVNDGTSCSSAAQCDNHLRCDGAEQCTEFGCRAGTAPSCDDMDPCTTDTCQESGDMCAHARMASCMGSVRSGVYTVAAPPMYSCSALGMEVVRFNITFFQFAVTATELTVTGAPADMTGPVPTGMDFTVAGVRTGDCNENYALRGTFTDATHFTGTYSISFSGITCGFTNCMARMFPVAGTLRM